MANSVLTLIKLQHDLVKTLVEQIVTLDKEKPLTDGYLEVLEEDITISFNEAKLRHKELLSKDVTKYVEITDYIDKSVFATIRKNYLALRGMIQDAHSKPCNKPNETLNSSILAPPKQQFDLRLPVIELLTFEGNYDQWMEFQSVFTSTVHNSSTLEDIQKMQYLRSCLKGDALNVIKNLELSDNNYSKARKLLSDRYHHPRRLVNAYLRKLYEYPTLKTESSIALKHFLDNINDCQTSLETLKSEITDYHFIYHMVKKLPTNTATAWEQSLGSSIELPTLDLFKDFLEKRYRVLEMTEIPDKEKETKKNQKTFHTKQTSSDVVKPNNKPSKSKTDKRSPQKTRWPPCILCQNSSHALFNCKRFLILNVHDKWSAIQNHKQCSNCLGNHLMEACKSTFRCKVCNERHHTFLHIYDANQPTTSFPIHPPLQENPTNIVHNYMTLNGFKDSKVFHTFTNEDTLKILGTAQVNAINMQSGQRQTVRVLLDPCSEESYITESAVQALDLPKSNYESSISTFGGAIVGKTNYRVQLNIQSLDNRFNFPLTAFIAPEITSDLPSISIPIENVEHLNTLKLADPSYFESRPIQILLGVGPTARIKENGIHRISSTLIAQKTKLGYIIEGEMLQGNSLEPKVNRVMMTKTKSIDLQNQIEKFWAIEELSDPPPVSPENLLCEKIFLSTINRRSDGHLAVDLPFTENKLPELGLSKHIAIRRFLSLEKKMQLPQNRALQEEYFNTIQDYLHQGHLVRCNPTNDFESEGYYIPHHAVVKPSSSTTRVRVVFDASCRTTNGTSLNSHLLTGPKLQPDIRNILCSWRQYPIALTADIAKMYRMFWVNEKHRQYQKIIWRFSQNNPLEEYSLATVTFGTSSAPYQAIRCLNYIADSNVDGYPLASKTIKTEFYVDDCITGAYSENEAIQKQKELRELLDSYGLNLRKWSSNFKSVMSDIPCELIDNSDELTFDETEFKKTLGIYWSPRADCFSFSAEKIEYKSNDCFTKREVLSLIARLYDPLGWVSPCTMHAKLFMQQLWKDKRNWDDPISESNSFEFLRFLRELQHLNRVNIPRWINTYDNHHMITILGFCDASERGYGAVIYLLNPNASNLSKNLILLTSRTRCCDLKYESVARWELNGALLLANLIDWALKLFINRNVAYFAYTDSKIVLAWLQSHPSRWKPYVANRSQKILSIVEYSKWRYVPTKMNPADLASRGLLPSQIIENNLWWYGPNLDDLNCTEHSVELSEDQSKYYDAEVKRSNVLLHLIPAGPRDYINKYSDQQKLIQEIRIHAKFALNCIERILKKDCTTDKKNRFNEIKKSIVHPELIAFRLLQKTYFPTEIRNLKKGKSVESDSCLKSMNPFIDGYGILRVGGRLDNSELPYSQKHPIILPGKSQITTNIIKDAHLDTHHGGNLITEHYLRTMYYIPRLSDRVRHFIHNCVTCRKFAIQRHTQLMGSLPLDRVNPSRAFIHTGVDYAGPITVKAYNGRCKIHLKSYIAVFVCLYSKAIHIEVVSSLTSEAFLAAFRRFVSRRGRCSKLFSDNGTNFKGADKILQLQIKQAEKSWKNELDIEFKKFGTEWHFIPPQSPHFGGLWEASVKSIKTHLVKTIGNSMLTFEELNTLLIQIEGVLNSRPLCPKSNNPEEFVALTPAHMLIGEPIVAPIEPFLGSNRPPIKRWNFIQYLHQQFNTSWLKDYSHRLQQRPKWLKGHNRYDVGNLVWVTDDNIPPTFWNLARIVDTHPGKDGQIRVVSLINKNRKVFKRPITKIRLLPLATSEDVQ